MDVKITSIGQNRGAHRVWLEGAMLTRAGFTPKTRYQIKTENGAVILTREDKGFRIVSARTRAEREIPIIDINSAEILAMFDGLEHVKVTFDEGSIYIEPLASELRARERVARATKKLATGEALSFGSLAHGGGVMDDALAAGFEEAGIKTHLKFANEIREDLTEHSINLGRTFTEKTIALNGKMQELAFDNEVMNSVGYVDIISAGLPCSGASVAGRVKRALVHPESHPEVGHLVVPFLAIIARLNPLAIELENVVPYGNSASMEIIRSMLADLGYIVHEAILEGADFGALENRKRMVMVAVTKGISFDFSLLEKPKFTPQTLGDILEPIALDDSRWSKMEGLKAKEVRDAANNKSFAMQIFTSESEKICTLTKGLSKNRSTDAKIQHPTNPELLRVPTPTEHARAKQIPEAMIAGLSATIAHEMLGQSVIYKKIVAVGKLLGQSIAALTAPKQEEEFFLTAC